MTVALYIVNILLIMDLETDGIFDACASVSDLLLDIPHT
jgi:hypothetical protein